MRRSVLASAAALTLMGATLILSLPMPVSAQEAVAETNAPQPSDPAEMVLRLNRLEALVRQLSGQIEELQFQNSKLQERLSQTEQKPAVQTAEASKPASQPGTRTFLIRMSIRMHRVLRNRLAPRLPRLKRLRSPQTPHQAVQSISLPLPIPISLLKKQRPIPLFPKARWLQRMALRLFRKPLPNPSPTSSTTAKHCTRAANS